MTRRDDELRPDGTPDDALDALGAAWRRLAPPAHDARADDAPSDADERAAIAWLSDAMARLAPPAFDAGRDDDAAERAARAWMAGAWERLEAPAPTAFRAAPDARRPALRVLGEDRRARLGWRRVAAAALVLLAFGLALWSGDADAARGEPSRVVDAHAPSSSDVAAAPDAPRLEPAQVAAARAAGTPWRSTSPIVVGDDRIESRAGRVRLVLLTPPPP